MCIDYTLSALHARYHPVVEHIPTNNKFSRNLVADNPENAFKHYYYTYNFRCSHLHCSTNVV